ncbi:glycoside hydrolase family 5 protein [Roseibium sediminicola]|uniref:Glycoside hydrolase family 5 protein n=1 Tax=Roseibium sediminicola TaxID=2933272 RepID=A0ABT0H395_9HYPH|nr:cellulase family glycosylhydrolase [Roseibium sp. CAU 1639]MCK7615568.1 glycoside hydrolase family 5 protein [Roseibium sp. CAU 1639]
MTFRTRRSLFWLVFSGLVLICILAGALIMQVRAQRIRADIVQAISSEDVVLPHFQRGINLSRLQNYAYRDPDRPGKYLWPPFRGPLSSISDSELDRLKALGMDFFRLPVDAGVFLAATDTERRILLDDLKTLILRLIEAGFSVMVDSHPATYSSDWKPKDILADTHGPRFQAYQTFLVDVAKRLRDLPADKVALELMNEPQSPCYRDDGEDWSVTQKRLFDSVRSAAPELVIVLTPACWHTLGGLENMSLEGYDGRTVFDFHFYDPYYLTHQSISWSQFPLRYIAGLTYPWTNGSIESAEKLTRRYQELLKEQGKELPDDAFDKAMSGIRDYYNRKRPDRAYVAGRFDTLAQWSEKYGIASERIVLGEFSAIRPPKGIPDDGSRLAWINDVRTIVEELGYGWALWSYDTEFGLLTDRDTKTIDPGIVDALGLNAEAAKLPVGP